MFYQKGVILTIFAILQPDMMQERFKLLNFVRETAEFTAAFITVNERIHLFGQKPIDQSKNRQA